MPQSLVLDNKIGEFIANETSSFVDRIVSYVDIGGSSSYFDFGAFNALDAIYSSPYPGYDTYILEEIIRESVYSLDTYRYIDYGPYGPGGYGPGYPIVDMIDTFGNGSVFGNINEEVISDLVSEELNYSDAPIQATYNASYTNDYHYDVEGGYEEFYLEGRVFDSGYLSNILEQASEVTGLNYVEANPDLDTVLSGGFLSFDSHIHGMDLNGSIGLLIDFIPESGWSISDSYQDIDYYGYSPGGGGYFDEYMFVSDLQMEIDMRWDPYVYLPGPGYPFDPLMELEMWGMGHYDGDVIDAFQAYGASYLAQEWVEYRDDQMMWDRFGFDTYEYPEFAILAENYMYGPGPDPYGPYGPYGPGGFIDSYSIAQNIAQQLRDNNYDYFNSPGYGYLDQYYIDQEFSYMLENINYELDYFYDDVNVYIQDPVNYPNFVVGESNPIIQSELSKLFPVQEVIDTEAINLSYQFVDENGDVIENIVVLGDDTETIYTLQIIADTLVDGFTLDSADIEFSYNSQLFEVINSDDLTMSEDFQEFSSFTTETPGTVRFAGANISDLDNSEGAANPNVLAELSLNFNEGGLSDLAKNEDGSFVDSDLGFSLSANLNDTVLSKVIDGGFNKEILSLAQFGGDKFTVEGSTDVYLYEQKTGILETGDGFTLSTDRIIGADAAETNLVRTGDTLNATTSFLNIGNVELDILEVLGVNSSESNVSLENYQLSKSTLDGGIFDGGSFTSSSDTAVLAADFSVIGAAGEIVDLSGVLDIKTSVGDETFSNTLGTKNLITYQGDLNYDGRVSMKDLAYLNAGAARVNSGGDVAGDVDANFDNSIDILDLAVLDADWGKTLHQGDQGFLGSSEITWEELDSQGSKTWDNAVFKEQNAFEAYQGFVGSLESPTSNVIGADGNTDANDDDMLGTIYQDLA